MSTCDVKRENKKNWDALILAGEEKIERLKKTIQRFKQYRDSGVVYPEEQGKTVREQESAPAKD